MPPRKKSAAPSAAPAYPGALSVVRSQAAELTRLREELREEREKVLALQEIDEAVKTIARIRLIRDQKTPRPENPGQRHLFVRRSAVRHEAHRGESFDSGTERIKSYPRAMVEVLANLSDSISSLPNVDELEEMVRGEQGDVEEDIRVLLYLLGSDQYEWEQNRHRFAIGCLEYHPKTGG